MTESEYLAEIARLTQERDEALIVREGLISPVQKVVQLKARVRVLEEALREVEHMSHDKTHDKTHAWRIARAALAAAAPPSEEETP